MGDFDDLIPKKGKQGGDFDDLIPAKPKAKAQEPSFFDSLRQAGEAVTRQVGIGGRAMLRGAYDLSGMLGGDLIGAAESAATGQRTRTSRESADWLADRIGLPRPETPTERVSSDITSAVTGGGGVIGIGRGLATQTPRAVSGIGRLLASQPATQIASAATGAGAASTTREAGGGTGAQLTAGLIGGMTPSFGVAGVSEALRRTVRGGEAGRATMERNIADFRRVGANPSVGQAAANNRTRGIESLLAGAPTSAGRMGAFAERQAEDIGGGLRGMADDFMPNASAERAGMAVKRGVTGEADKPGFVQTSRETANELYRQLDETIPKGSRVDVQSTRAALADLNSMIDGAPSVSRFFQNARLEGIERGLLSDVGGAEAVLTQPGMRENVDAYRQYLQGQAQQIAERNASRKALGMNVMESVPSAADIERNIMDTLGNMVDQRLPYEALQKLRTLVGNEIEGATLTSDVPRSKWKALYGALSRDMEAAATTPEAKQALSRANAYYNARIARLDAIDAVVNKHGGAEKIYNAVIAGTQDGGTTLRAVMQSLPKDGQRAVTAAIIKRMGLATPGQQGAAGDTFSAQTFLTNWNRLSPEAKRAAFDRHGPRFSADMDKVARVAANIRDGSRVFANPSGTANRAAAIGYYGSLAASTGAAAMGAGPVPLASLVLGGLSANAAARAMTSPRVVSWLARATEMPVSSLPQQVMLLKSQAQASGDEDLAELAAALEQQGNGQGDN